MSEVIDEIGEIFSTLPPISPTLTVRYISQRTMTLLHQKNYNYSPTFLEKKLRWAIQYWKSERDAIPVGEKNAWKCKHCKFLTSCMIGQQRTKHLDKKIKD